MDGPATRGKKRAQDDLVASEENFTTCCTICLDQLSGRDVSVLPCGHTFHSCCIMSNVISTGSLKCPNCREALVAGPSEESDSDSDSESSTEEQIEMIADRMQKKLTRDDAIACPS